MPFRSNRARRVSKASREQSGSSADPRNHDKNGVVLLGQNKGTTILTKNTKFGIAKSNGVFFDAGYLQIFMPA